MRERTHITVLTRRTVLVTAAAAVAYPAMRAAADDAPASSQLERSPQFEEAFAKLVAGATPVEGKITVDLPEIAENGNFVPVIISVDSPMTAESYVSAIHLLSTANPVAKIATFHLSPLNGAARVQSRIRLAKTQDVLVLAELSSGELAIATETVKVTIGGCSN